MLQHRDSHRATVQDHVGDCDVLLCVLLRDLALCAVNLFLSSLRWLLDMEFYRVISTAWLSGLPHLYVRPIDVLVLHGP